MRTGKGRPLTTLSVSQTLTKVERINPNISGKEQPGRSWSRAKRETTGKRKADFFHDPGRAHGLNSRRLVFDTRPHPGSMTRGTSCSGLALRARPPATVRDASGVKKDAQRATLRFVIRRIRHQLA